MALSGAVAGGSKIDVLFNEGAQTVSDTTIATGTQVQDALFRALHKKPEASRTTLANDGQPEPQQAAKQRAKP